VGETEQACSRTAAVRVIGCRVKRVRELIGQVVGKIRFDAGRVNDGGAVAPR